jgi:hypothetical protein
VITIRAGHSVTASTFFSADEIVVESGGTLSHTNGGFTVADGPDDDIQVFGTLIHSGNSFTGPGNIRILSGGSFQWTGGGQLNADMTLDLDQGSTASSSSTSPLLNNGTINNAGTWTLVNGGFSSTVLPSTFHNLGTGIVELNGWASPTNSWAQVTINDGIINKNNGAVTFTTTGRPWTNNGTINVPLGTWRNSTPSSCTNAGEFAFGGTGTVLRPNGDFTNTASGSINGLGHLQLQSGTYTMAAGSSMNTVDTLTVATFSTLVVNEDIDAQEMDFSGGTINGTAAVNIQAGGRLDWTGGNNNANLNIGAGAVATFLATSTVSNSGIINNAGTFLMDGGNLSQITTPCRFKNLPTGVLDLNGWTSPTSTWIQNVFNQGIINKNNGNVQFTLVFALTNEPGGVVNVNSGDLALAPSFSLPVQTGVFNVTDGASLSTSASGIPFAGPQFNNNGAVNASLKFQGSSAQQLNGAGTITSLTINNAAGVDLGGEQTVTNTLTLTTGQLRLGDNDLLVENNVPGAVAGGNSSSWVVNDGSGSLHRQAINGGYLFPVGTTSYTPLTLNVTPPQDRFGVRVQDGVSTDYGAPGTATGAPITARSVDRTWIVAEEVDGGNTADITVQWNAGDEMPLFNRSLCSVGQYDGTEWITGTYAPALGLGPFNRTISGANEFREYSVSDNLLNLNTALKDPSTQSRPLARIWPLPADQVLNISIADGGSLNTLRILDLSGRVVFDLNKPWSGALRVDVGALPAATYVVEWRDAVQQSGQMPFVIAR